MREWGNERMRKWENEKMREWENERMRKWGLSVYSTLPKVRAAQAVWATRAKFLAKCISQKWRIGVFGRYRRSSEEGREGFWWKKAIRWVWLAYRELIRILDDWYRKGV